MGQLYALAAFLLAADAAPVRQPPSVRPSAEATVTVRIVQGAAVRFDRGKSNVWKFRAGSVRGEDGRRLPAQLVEFE